MPKNFVSYDNAEDLMEGINSKKVSKSDLTSIFATGTTNTTGSVIENEKYFYLNGVLVKAISDIAVGDTFTEDTNYEVITDGALNKNSGSGGHTIEDAAGNVLQQQDTMQFLGGLKATNDPTNGKTKIDDTPTLVTWAEWNAMTPEQRAAIPKAQITNVPGADGTISAEVFKELWRNQSPTSNFAAQSVTLASDDYDFLMILYRESTSISFQSVTITAKGTGGTLCVGDIGAAGDTNRIRRFYVTSSTVLNFAGGNVGSSSAIASNDGVVIPVVIYGFKKTLSLNFSAIASDVSTLASKCMMADGVTSIADAIKWKTHVLDQVVTMNGSSKVSLPSTFDELLIVFKIATVVYGRYNIAALELSSTSRLERSCGYYEGVNYNADVLLYINNEEVYGAVRLKGVEQTTTIDIYYR